MDNKIDIFNKAQLKKDIPDIKPGDVVRIHQKIKDKDKDLPALHTGQAGGRQGRIQVFEGLIIAIKHGKGISAAVTVRKVISGVGVERIFPVHSPIIEKIEIVRRGKVRRAKLYYLRKATGKKAILKRKEFTEAMAKPAAEETPQESSPETAGQK